ncbi:MAG: LacI family transcriptional regulator [Conexibacter sp.]|nr:LacI family transcriptional regulator [Conexibacter sp.]
MSSRSVSIADVAAAAGVSATTVSHVISGRRPVGEQTAAGVRAAMRELGYVPNHVAQSLRRGHSRTIGLLVPDIANPYFAELARGAEDAAEARGLSLLLCNTAFDAAREERYLDVLRAGRVDGMLYAAGAPPRTERLAELARTFQLVIVDEELEGVAASSVVSDNARGGRLAGEHLRALGHRDVLVLEGPRELRSARDRGAGFAAAFAGCEARLTHVAGDYRADRTAAAVAQALAARRGGAPPFTAVFAANDVVALAAIEALAVAGLRVPQDVSVVGYDDTVLAGLVRPALTTVRQPVQRMGWIAAERLAAALAGEDGSELSRVVLDVELVARQSSGPATGPTTKGASR